MKKYLITGLAIILPFGVTLFLVQAIISFLTTPFHGLVEQFFPQGSLDPLLLTFLSKGLILVCLFFFTVGVGYSAEYLLVHTLMGWGNQLIGKIPLIGTIYQMIHDIIHTFYGKQEQFSQVAKVPFPHLESSALGFMTNGEMTIQGREDLGTFASLYIPGNPNPIMGFWLLVPKERLTPLELSAKEASRFIFSCGILKVKNGENNGS